MEKRNQQSTIKNGFLFFIITLGIISFPLFLSGSAAGSKETKEIIFIVLIFSFFAGIFFDLVFRKFDSSFNGKFPEWFKGLIFIGTFGAITSFLIYEDFTGSIISFFIFGIVGLIIVTIFDALKIMPKRD